MWLNACSSGISVATGICSVATFATFIGLPVSIPLDAASLTGVIASGIISVLTKKYQKKLKNVTQLIDMIMSQSIPTGYTPPRATPGEVFLSELIRPPGLFFCLIPCPGAKNNG